MLVVVIILGVWRYIEARNRQTDSNWKLAEQIYNMENALKEVDANFECKSTGSPKSKSWLDPIAPEGSMGDLYLLFQLLVTSGISWLMEA